MQSSHTCPMCAAPVRFALTTTGSTILDPVAVADGNVWVVGFEDHVPRVSIEAKPADVPAGEPLRYREHTCV